MNTSESYVIGQRWLSQADPELGLGIILSIEGRCVQMGFPAVEEERTYAIKQAPLCRIMYRVGDTIQTISHLTLTVTAVQSLNGFLIYLGLDDAGEEHQILESDLHHSVNFSAPLERLLSGQVDKHKYYALKIQTLKLLSRLQQSNVQGLIGARTQFIPHQVHIANNVAKRFAPRVLLADEVGLGKTIEAGMILHHQLITGRAKRILIIVPGSLIHQWFVEMLRRFNLSFSIFNQERYQAIEDINPFESEQLIITSLDFLMKDEAAKQHAHQSCWDIVVVDEAHHLHWSEEKPSPEYLCIEQFATQCQGLLLLTATPEQLGIESHFARLRLLDSARFKNLDAFKQDEENFKHIKELAQALIDCRENSSDDRMPTALQEKISLTLGKPISHCVSETLSMLLDQHGTGRMLFRNTRAAISGFPKRCLHPTFLEKPEIYHDLSITKDESMLHPETFIPQKEWLDNDPRVSWLITTLRQLRPNKVLIITANATTAIALEMYLRLNTGIRTLAFHEGLSIVERDRASAYFADDDAGADCLICSEIGSEGRNFQFAHELILFDLPLNPDLLEQRIGRLDRIGQTHEINIHLPIIQDTPMETLFRWFHEGLNLFEKSCSFGSSLYDTFKDELAPFLKNQPTDESQFESLLLKTQQHARVLQTRNEAGRDRLLELSSCNTNSAKALIDNIHQEENPVELQEYMARVFNAYGVSHEYHSENTEILHPSEHMKTNYFPGLKEEGNTVTYCREKALLREDIEFLSFEHPMVREAMEMILSENDGSAMLCTMSLNTLPAGTLLLEAFYTVRTHAPKALDLNRFLPLTPIRILTSLSANNLDAVISHEQLSLLCKAVKRQHTPAIIGQIRSQIETMVEHAKQHANDAMPRIKQEAVTKLNQELGLELSRLQALKQINPSIREEEISFLENQMSLTENAISEATLHLEGLRMVINQ